MTSEITLVVVAAVNKDEVLAGNLAASPIFENGNIPLIVERGHLSAGEAYNCALDKTTANVVIFAHQDVYLPKGWETKLISTIQSLDDDNGNWAVLGVIGMDMRGNLVGRTWSTGLQLKIETQFSSPCPVQSIDEIVIVLRRKSGLRFDCSLPGFHLYGTDIVQSAKKAGFEAYVFDGPVIHNSLPVIRLDSGYRKAYRYVRKKWRKHLPVYTTIIPLLWSQWPLIRYRLFLMRQRVFKGNKKVFRHSNPSILARELEYECLE